MNITKQIIIPGNKYGKENILSISYTFFLVLTLTSCANRRIIITKNEGRFSKLYLEIKTTQYRMAPTHGFYTNIDLVSQKEKLFLCDM